MTEITLASTWDFATQAHGAQKDKQGNPYSVHLAAVWQGVRDLGGDVIAEHVAILHDVVEDTPVTYAKLREMGYCEDVIFTLTAVTKKNGEQNTLYIGRVIAAGDRAMLVKLADLYHNVEEARMATLAVETQKRLKYKYYHAISRIERELDMDYSISDEDYALSQEYKKAVTSYIPSTYKTGRTWDAVQKQWVDPVPVRKVWNEASKKWVDYVSPVHQSPVYEPPLLPESGYDEWAGWLADE